jgi:hypothetical protein
VLHEQASLTLCKAILSQFSKKNATTTDMEETTEDEAIFQMLDGESEDDCVVELDIEGDQDGDEIDPAVEEHDAAMVDAIVDALALEEDDAQFIDSLTHEQVNLGRFSVTKVSALNLIKCELDLYER